MSKIVWLSFPAHGHINPTLPVVAELVRRGNDVAYYATERFYKKVAATGASFRTYGGAFTMPEHGAGPFARIATTLDALLKLSRAVLENDLLAIGGERPSVIVRDSFAPWGLFVADKLGLRSIVSVPSILVNDAVVSHYGSEADSAGEPQLTREWFAEITERCSAFAREFGLDELPVAEWLQRYGDLNLVYTSTLFQPLSECFPAERFRFAGPSIGMRLGDPPFPFDELDGSRPLVFVSMGTVYGDGPRLVQTCLDAFADGPWQVVIATGSGAGWSSPPVFVQAAVPQLEILKRADVFVTHAGMNSVNEALFYDVPLVCIPHGADQFWIARRAEELGAAVLLMRESVTPTALRESVARVMDRPSYAAAATRIGDSLRSAGGYLAASDAIEDFLSHL